MSRLGRVPLTLVALGTSLGPYIADFNETHVYNPLWLPHAKFHNGQTMSLGLVLGLATAFWTWRDVTPALAGAGGPKGDLSAPEKAASVRVRKAHEAQRLQFVTFVASAYWVTQLSAWFYPGALALDPPGDPHAFPQFWISSFFLVLTAMGVGLERRALL